MSLEHRRVLLAFFLFALYIFYSRGDKPPETDWTHILDETQVARPHTASLGAVLAATRSSLPILKDTLASLIGPSSCVTKVLVICPESLVAQTRVVIQQTVRDQSNHQQPDVALHPIPGSRSTVSAGDLFKASARLGTEVERVLLLDGEGLDGLSRRTRDMLLCPTATKLPLGPRGFDASNHSCVAPSVNAQVAAYLLPPFTVPATLLQDPGESWAAMGDLVSQKYSVGGIIQSFGDEDTNYCGPPVQTQQPQVLDTQTTFDAIVDDLGLFVFLFPTLDVLQDALPMACALHEAGHEIRILLYSDTRPASAARGSSRCQLQYESLRKKHDDARALSAIQEWLGEQDRKADVLVTLDELPKWTSAVIRLPRQDLAYAQWMGTLSLREWLHWNTPRIDISVITQDRPQSLRRLLSSLTGARYFGDTVNMRLNMEQSSDRDTMEMLGKYTWNHGSVSAHRRVVHAGLITAVVESWYPHSNDDYGLLLEDDVELSPLFYAWVKMTILRYRYGQERDRTKSLFGISLYQLKNTELRLQGRQQFDPRKLFAENHFPHPSTPYLSQVPCSWGAVYFPEHWREFHDYLAERLSQSRMRIGENVVADVRSNNWSRSWKKFFIELVHLRGYVMLYPNYADFASFSTNHLEVGSHVKERSRDKQKAFRRPLLELREVRRLVDELPARTLPGWRALPVLNLTGYLVAHVF
ncbi:Succinate dehydrogenase [ubiquinone] iron-sulfur subunit, mitochondrial [Mycena kentingensis (nom. inval.)]|nr:Succinate dehydrogenase [ubiquinone] iron-sulfur subunit, mitochondrial [Mycena kentingensis (nom. inval.)]